MSHRPPPAEASLDDLLASVRARYAVHFEPVTVGGASLELLQLDDMEAYLDRLLAQTDPAKSLELPFWAKIWRSSLLLAHYVQRLPPGAEALEIGAGVGLVGLFAAARGLRVTISDIDADAVLFTRIAILHNGLAHRATAARVDFTSDRLERRYDYILGSEILLRDDTYRGLTKFLRAHLAPAPESEVILVKEYARTAKKFFKLAADDFRWSELTLGFKGAEADEKHLAQIIRMRSL